MSNISKNNSVNNILETKDLLNMQLSEEDLIIKYINELKDEEKRTKAISKLSKYYDKYLNLPIYLWYSQGTMAIFLQEIISSYKYLSSEKITPENSTKICNILLLLTCITSHNEIKYKFIESKMPIFLYPFLKSTSTIKQIEYIKLLSLTVISNLIKTQEPEIISFFIKTELIPILLKLIEKGPLISKIPACLMIRLIVKADEGLKFICEERMRYSAIILFMRQMLKNKHNTNIVDSTLKIFIRLSENNEARIILKNNLLKEIKERKFTKHLKDSSKLLHSCLLKILCEKDDVNKANENQKDLNNRNGIANNVLKNQNLKLINDNMKNGINIGNNNQQMNGDVIKQFNINNNMLLLNQMKISQPYLIQTNLNDVNNFNMYNKGNENYLNKMNYVGNQNNNKQFMNMNFYNMYKSN